MTEPERESIALLVAAPAAWRPVAESVRMACCRCDQLVWVNVRFLSTVAEPGARVMCVPCFADQLRDSRG